MGVCKGEGASVGQAVDEGEGEVEDLAEDEGKGEGEQWLRVRVGVTIRFSVRATISNG